MAPVVPLVLRGLLILGVAKLVEKLMGHTDQTYVIFDGDKDQYAYRFMRGWKASQHISFDFVDAHDVQPLTSRADDEKYIKGVLRERMKKASQVIVLIGESTKHLYKYVRWELELALEMGLPIIAVNLNESRAQDGQCPAIIRDKCVVHIPFKMKAIKHALDNWPSYSRGLSADKRSTGPWYYKDAVYEELGL